MSVFLLQLFCKLTTIRAYALIFCSRHTAGNWVNRGLLHFYWSILLVIQNSLPLPRCLWLSQCGRGELNEKKERYCLLRASSAVFFKTELCWNWVRLPYLFIWNLVHLPKGTHHIVSYIMDTNDRYKKNGLTFMWVHEYRHFFFGQFSCMGETWRKHWPKCLCSCVAFQHELCCIWAYLPYIYVETSPYRLLLSS